MDVVGSINAIKDVDWTGFAAGVSTSKYGAVVWRNTLEKFEIYAAGYDYPIHINNVLFVDTDTNNGNVGIGTTNPSDKLHVIGSIIASGTICDSNGTNCIGAGGGGDITSVIAGTGLTEGGTTGDVTLNIDTTYVQRRVTGTCIGQVVVGINSDGTVTCEPDDTGTGYWSESGGNVYRSTGNVGMGTSSPIARLDVAGVIRARDIYPAGSQNIIIGDDVFLTDIDISNMLGIYGMQFSDKAGIRLGSDGSYIFGDNGNIGIGTTSPTQKLDVSGEIHATGDICTDVGGGKCLSSGGFIPSFYNGEESITFPNGMIMKMGYTALGGTEEVFVTFNTLI